jgi:hypothetical protein
MQASLAKQKMSPTSTVFQVHEFWKVSNIHKVSANCEFCREK